MIEIKFGTLRDVPEITDLFNYYILNTNARFEEQVFSYENRTQWFAQFCRSSKYQLYVAVEHEKLLGFACSQQYRSSCAFNDTVEVTIYLSKAVKGKGIGSLLYGHLLSELKKQAVHRALSGIALPNDASLALHRKFGFKQVGIFDQYAKKHGSYISSVWLEKQFS